MENIAQTHILLVEDEKLDAQIIQLTIKKTSDHPVLITHVPNLEQTILALESKNKFDIILLDLNLPDSFGKNLVKELIQISGAPPIIILSGHANNAQARRAVIDGAQDYISKNEIAHIDITQKINHAIERHRLVQDLRKAQEEAAKANEAKSQFLAMMSHEIRTPLNGILGIAKILAEGPLKNEDRENVQIIRQSGENLLHIINDILDFSKVEAGKIQLEKINFDLVELIDDIEKTQRKTHQDKSITLVVEKNLPTHHLIGDPARLRQVLLNLISNAYKFTKRGRVWLKASATAESSDKMRFRFEVQDEGIGIPSHALDRIFSAFSQADTSISRRFGGTGLGLSICQRLVTLMGGKIGVSSIEGAGATFWFEIPILVDKQNIYDGQRKLNTEVTISAPLRADQKKHRILVVDDNVINQKIASAFLEKLGYQCDCVGSGEEALAALRDLPYDLILMDCQMPDLDGYETTKIIRISETLPHKHIPIVAMTANVLGEERERCMEAGMDEYLTKPIDFNKMAQVISDIIIKNKPPTHHPAETDTALNGERLDQLKSLDLPGMIPIIVEIGGEFLKDFPEKMRLLESNINSRDIKGTRFLAHQLVSNTGNLAAITLSNLFRKLENLDEKVFWEECMPLLSEIKSEALRVESALSNEIGKAS